MDIAALSIGLSQMKAQQQAAMSVMKLAMNAAKTQADNMAAAVARTSNVPAVARHPDSGGQLDIKV